MEDLKKMKHTNSTLRSTLKKERLALIDALEQLIVVYNEKMLAGSVDYVQKFEKARIKLDHLKGK